MKLFERINLFPIFSKHFSTLYDFGELQWNGNRRIPSSDKFTFIWFPIIVSSLLVILEIRINETYISLIITALAIFVGLLFNFLILVYGIAKEEKEKPVSIEQKIKFELSKELFVNIAYSIALSLLSIICVFFTRFNPPVINHVLMSYNLYERIKTPYLIITNFVAIFLIIEFVLVLLMVLKRFFLLFNKEFE